MKKYIHLIITVCIIVVVIIVIALLMMGENNNEDKDINTSLNTNPAYNLDENNPNYRQAMRQWVITISEIAKKHNENFLIIPQNCAPLFTYSGETNGAISLEFLSAIDAIGIEAISYGYQKYNKPRPKLNKYELLSLLDIGANNNIGVLTVDYCDDEDQIKEAKELYDTYGYLGYIAESIELSDIPNDKIDASKEDIRVLSDAKSLLYLLNPEKYHSKEELIYALSMTNYDVIIIDAYFDGDEMLSSDDVSRLKEKENGASRLVIAYLSIGEAEDYRYYWMDEYDKTQPSWLLVENPMWKGNYPVKYWDSSWQEIIATGEDSYLKRILSAGYDGAYLDIVDGYETFEDME